MKKVLVITYYWPPSGGSGVQRWVKFAKYLPDFGWEPIIYTPENPELTSVDKTLLNEISPKLKVLKRPIFEPYGIYRTVMGKNASTDMKTLTEKKTSTEKNISGNHDLNENTEVKADSGVINPISGEKKTFKQWLPLFIRGNFFIPDPRCFWVRPSVRYLKKYLKDNPVDVIVTTGPPQSMHLIGEKLSKATGIPWVPDFRDPWTKMYYYKNMELLPMVDKIHHKMEKRVLDNADEVLTVTPMMAKDFAEQTKTPIEVITNGYDEEDFDIVVEDDGYFNIVHTGLFSADGNPEVLWEMLREKASHDAEFKDMLRIRFVGRVDEGILSSIREYGLEEHLHNLGYKSHSVAVREQKCASLLILPLRKDPDYKIILPGKLFEYFAARHPILGIGQEDGAMANLIDYTKSGDVFDWDNKEGVKQFIDQAWDKFKQDQLVVDSVHIEEFSRKNLSKSLAKMLDRVAKK